MTSKTYRHQKKIKIKHKNNFLIKKINKNKQVIGALVVFYKFKLKIHSI